MNQSRGSRFGRRDGGPRDNPPRSPYRNQQPPRRWSRSPSPRRDNRRGDMYRFGGDQRNEGRRDDNRSNFNFRMPTRRQSPSGRGGRARSPPRPFKEFDQGEEFRDRMGGDHYRGSAAGRSPPHRQEDGRGRPPPRGPRHWNPNTRDAIKERYQQNKFFRKPFQAHERPLLHQARATTPEQLEGMQKSGFEFPMDEGEDHEEHHDGSEDSGAEDGEAPMEIEEDEDSKPTESVVKGGDAEELEKAENIKKNVIAMIRKAKKAIPVKEQRNAVADNDDFIPLDFGFGDDNKSEVAEVEEESEEEESEEDEEEERRKIRKTSMASGTDGDSTPKFAVPSDGKFSHRDALHQVLKTQSPKEGPPGAKGTLTAVAGPPPGLGEAKKSKNVFGDDDDSDAEVVTVAPANPKKRKLAERSAKLKTSMQGHFRYEYRIVPGSRVDATPWMRDDVDHSQTLRMNDWLHKEIVDFVEFLGPTDVDKAVRQHVIYRVQKAVIAVFRDADVRCFGSFASNFFLPGSDLDLVLLSRTFLETGRPKYNESRDLYDVAGILRRKIARYGSVVVIAKARVPIIKFVDDMTGLHVDISFENTSGLRAIATLQEWRKTHPALPFLATMMKQYLLMRNMHEVYEGGIGGFSIICMIVAFLRLHPAFASDTLDASKNLGVAFMEFLDLYGNRLNTHEVGIDPAQGKYFTKPQVPFSQQGKHHRPYLLSIIDPNDKDNDISKSSYQVLEIFKCFSESLEVLKEEMERIEALPLAERKGESLLKCIFGANYSEIINLRKHMRDIFDRDVPRNFLPQGEQMEGLINASVPPPPPPHALPARPPPPPPPPVERSFPPRGPAQSRNGLPVPPASYKPKYGKNVKADRYDSSAGSSKRGGDSDDELMEVAADDWDKSRKRSKHRK